MRSPSQPPSPSQPGRSLLALLEAKQCDPPPSRRSNTPSTSVSQPRAASQPAQSCFNRQKSISTGGADVTFTVGTGVGTFTLMGQIAFTLNIKAEAQQRMRSEATAHPSEREEAQHYRSTDLPVYDIGRSFETFGWVPPMTKGWGETSGCATLWGCSMVHRGKNIVNGSKKSPISPCNVRAVRSLCPRRACCARAVHKRPQRPSGRLGTRESRRARQRDALIL